MKCTLERTIFKGQDGYQVASFRTLEKEVPKDVCPNPDPQGYYRFVAYGNYLPETEALDVEMSGVWTEDQKYGRQLKVLSCSEILPTKREGIIDYLSSGLINGIGPRIAQSIVAKFGANTFDVIEKTPEKLLSISGITEKRLQSITESYMESHSLRHIVCYLGPYGISVSQAKRILREFGVRSVEIVENSPYELCAICGFGFKTVDAIAKKVRCKPNDPLRVKGAIQYILHSGASEKGAVSLPREEIVERAEELLNEGHSKPVVRVKEIQGLIAKMLQERSLFWLGKEMYLPVYFRAEVGVAKYVAEMLTTRLTQPKYTKADLEKAAGDLQLTAKQTDAVKMVFANTLSILTGGPGTGKTTIIKTIISLYQQIFSNDRLLLVAPTGRASRRMAEATGFAEAMTLHSALNLYSAEDDGDYYAGSEDDLDADLIICDESTMVDLRLAEEFFKRIRPGTRVLLVGDPDQLPPVGAGNVFQSLLASSLIPMTRLDIIHRQARDSRIIGNAEKIRKGDGKLDYGPDFQFVDCDTLDEAAETVEKLYVELVKTQNPNQVQAMSPLRSKTVAGSDALNERLRGIANPASAGKPQIKYGKRIFRLGDRVIQLKNRDPVFNGDIGTVSKVTSEGLTITFLDGLTRDYEREHLNQLSLAYAITIHKSQGSEYETVIITLMTAFYRMLQRNLIYTAITRAKSKVIIVGQRKALAIAVKRNISDPHCRVDRWIPPYVKRIMDRENEAAS